MNERINYKFYRKNLLNNFNKLKQINPKTKVCCIVKANAYGVGAESVVKTLSGLADFFGVATINEAIQVRNLDNKTPILILTPVETKYINECIKNNISIAVSSLQQLSELVDLTETVKVHLKVNTGLNRLGLSTKQEIKQAIKIFKENKNLIFEGFFTHFSNSDCENEDFLHLQFKKFKKYFPLIQKDFSPIVHCANTAAAIKSGEYACDMVRVGKGLYGSNPIPNYKKLDLWPVVELTTKIIDIHEIKKGDCVSYNLNFIAKNNMKISTIGIGFADGYKRVFSNNARVIINDCYCNVIGNVCMDTCMVDISNVKNTKIDDEVILIGCSNEKEISLLELSKRANTSIYEILTSLKQNRMNLLSYDE